MTATSISDAERREVALRLRGLHLNPWDDAACEIAQCAGIACCNSECHGSNETPECTMALCAHLADLMEPSCDRDALLALADELDRDGRIQRERQKAGEKWFVNGLDVMDYAHRIREALGVDA